MQVQPLKDKDILEFLAVLLHGYVTQKLYGHKRKRSKWRKKVWQTGLWDFLPLDFYTWHQQKNSPPSLTRNFSTVATCQEPIVALLGNY